MKTHVIITFSKSHYFITSEQNEKLKQLNIEEEVLIEGATVRMKNIAEIVPVEKYYETYPHKKPIQKTKLFKPLPDVHKKYSVKGHQKKIECLKRGFLKGVAKARNIQSVTYNDLKHHQKEIYDKMEDTLQQIESC